MKGYDPADAKQNILSKLEKKPFQAIEAALPRLIEDFIQYDLHFMRITGVLDANDEQGENTYDEDEAFEYLYDAYLYDHPDDEDESMRIASLLNRYMELQYEYLAARGLTESEL
ncbi:MAG: hypothetical protein RSB91_02555 [Clostridia bacterium]